MTLKRFQSIALIIVTLFVASESFAQKDPPKTKKVNFGYSKNPPIREVKVKPVVKKPGSAKNKTGKGEKKVEKPVADSTAKNTEFSKGSNVLENPNNTKSIAVKTVDGKKNDPSVDSGRTIAKKTREIANKAAKANLSPMEIYRVGAGDVLFIGLQNGKSSSSKYYTVLNDGTVDYPLGGGLISVSGLIADEIEDLLREKIKLYKNPEVSVRVREHASHKISVLGLVEKQGDKFLQREAMPLYVIKAEAVVNSKADQVTIRRQGSEPETFALADEERQGYLIYPGDVLEFGSAEADRRAAGASGFVYMGSFVRESGKQEYSSGITLTQAILTSGGLKSSKTKKIAVRRKNSEGLLETNIYNIKDIKNGKVPDPILEPGDIVEKG